ncbi:hypothetical protein M427DRAFT_60701 [Gonapodya prolifera JEL478]|uniref:Uncharacterized protein n=1 Tax=Gonapodya prolifera (strain JEL478) TaxID=1344416 RepID=A0A139A3U5_GONPJ|nr:hypothetical protein M427DRAFT_60701 [Gonapodya prolifera JEL478]|eukprot:KXS11472.1 hypothetical protein M427DRAFT_60701 [Gonapodya prolifera JEL478]
MLRWHHPPRILFFLRDPSFFIAVRLLSSSPATSHIQPNGPLPNSITTLHQYSAVPSSLIFSRPLNENYRWGSFQPSPSSHPTFSDGRHFTTSRPSYQRPPVVPQPVKTALAIGGGVVVFYYAQPILYTLISALLGYTSYRFLRSRLDTWFPSPPSPFGPFPFGTGSTLTRSAPGPFGTTIPFPFSIPFQGIFRAAESQARIANDVVEVSKDVIREWLRSPAAPREIKQGLLASSMDDIVTLPPHAVAISTTQSSAGDPTTSTHVEVSYILKTEHPGLGPHGVVSVVADVVGGQDVTLRKLRLVWGGRAWDVPTRGGRARRGGVVDVDFEEVGR